MSILQFKFCPECGERTYHRYRNNLRCGFTTCNGWDCIACTGKLHKRRRSVKASDKSATAFGSRRSVGPDA